MVDGSAPAAEDSRVMLPLRYLLLLGISSAALAQTDLAPPNPDALLRELEMIEKKRDETKNSARNAILARVQKASSSGTNASILYIDAVEAVNFQGKQNKVEDFINWKKTNGDALRSREAQLALTLYLKYAALSMLRRGSEKPLEFVAPSLAYLDELIAATDSVRSAKPDDVRNLLSRPVGQSVIAQYLGIAPFLPEDKSWEASPGNVNGILEKNIRPALREAKDPALLQTWELQLKYEADRVTQDRSAHQIEQFNSVNRPRLIFQRAKDMALLGQPNRALNEMVGLVRANPTHPDFAAWVAEIRKGLSTPATPETSPAADPGSAP